MSGIGVKLPLQKDPVYGFGVTKNVRENIKQSLKMLILTNPGERMMLPEYGAGLRNYLFEQNTEVTHAAAISEIENQVGIYMPYLNILEIKVGDNPPGVDLRDFNIFHLIVNYEVPNIHGKEQLNLYLENLNPY